MAGLPGCDRRTRSAQLAS
uniref:Uncharacterized protein n=1 Tax=Zea mays TaxID=4577 RepID=C4J186_MAIZE|nr:unknown [Zea mays]